MWTHLFEVLFTGAAIFALFPLAVIAALAGAVGLLDRLSRASWVKSRNLACAPRALVGSNHATLF
jgi:hypothetical protein